MIPFRSSPRGPAAQSTSENGSWLSRISGRLLGRRRASPDARTPAKLDAFRALIRHPGPGCDPELRAIMDIVEHLFADDAVVRHAFAGYGDAVERSAPPSMQAELLLEILASLALHLDMAGQVDVEDLRAVAEKQAGDLPRSGSDDAAVDAELFETAAAVEAPEEGGDDASLSGFEPEEQPGLRPSVSDLLSTLLASDRLPSSRSALASPRPFELVHQAPRPAAVKPRTLAQVRAYLDDVEHRWSRAA